jgi:hypothetical protein
VIAFYLTLELVFYYSWNDEIFIFFHKTALNFATIYSLWFAYVPLRNHVCYYGLIWKTYKALQWTVHTGHNTRNVTGMKWPISGPTNYSRTSDQIRWNSMMGMTFRQLQVAIRVR